MTDNKKHRVEFSFIELQILRKLAKGKMYQEIADELGISFFEVTVHVKTIFTKLDPGITSGETEN